MRIIEYTITDKNGIHARPAGIIVTAAKSFDCDITIEYGGKSADCKRLFSVMALGVGSGDTVKIKADGEGEEEALEKIKCAMTDAGL